MATTFSSLGQTQASDAPTLTDSVLMVTASLYLPPSLPPSGLVTLWDTRENKCVMFWKAGASEIGNFKNEGGTWREELLRERSYL